MVRGTNPLRQRYRFRSIMHGIPRTVTDSRVVRLKPCYRGAMTTPSEGGSERFADEADIDTIEMELSAANVLALSRAAERAAAATEKHQNASGDVPTVGAGGAVAVPVRADSSAPPAMPVAAIS